MSTTMLVRRVEDDFMALTVAAAAEAIGAKVVSIVYAKGGMRPWHVFIRADGFIGTSEEVSKQVDAAIESAFKQINGG